MDDEASIREVLGDFLEVLGHQVVQASNGLLAYESFKEAKEPFELIITDLKMPGLDGMELISRVRSMNEQVGIILISGFGMSEIVNKDILTRVAFFEKPLDFNLLEEYLTLCPTADSFA